MRSCNTNLMQSNLHATTTRLSLLSSIPISIGFLWHHEPKGVRPQISHMTYQLTLTRLHVGKYTLMLWLNALKITPYKMYTLHSTDHLHYVFQSQHCLSYILHHTLSCMCGPLTITHECMSMLSWNKSHCSMVNIKVNGLVLLCYPILLINLRPIKKLCTKPGIYIACLQGWNKFQYIFHSQSGKITACSVNYVPAEQSTAVAKVIVALEQLKQVLRDVN